MRKNVIRNIFIIVIAILMNSSLTGGLKTIKAITTPTYEEEVLYSGGSKGHNAGLQGKTSSVNASENYILSGKYDNGILRGKIPLTYSLNGVVKEKVLDFGNVRTDLISISLNDNNDFVGLVYTNDNTNTISHIIVGNLNDESTFSIVAAPSTVATYLNSVILYKTGEFIIGGELNNASNQTSAILLKGNISDLKNNVFNTSSVQTVVIKQNTSDTDYWIDHIEISKTGEIVYRGYEYKNNEREKILFGKAKVSDLTQNETIFIGDGDLRNLYHIFAVNNNGQFAMYGFEYTSGNSTPQDVMYIGNTNDLSSIRKDNVDGTYKIYNTSGSIDINDNGDILLVTQPFGSDQVVYFNKFKVSDADYNHMETYDLTQFKSSAYTNNLTGHIISVKLDNFGNFVAGGNLALAKSADLSIPGETGLGGHGYAPYLIIGNKDDFSSYKVKVYGDANADNGSGAQSSVYTMKKINSSIYAFGSRRSMPNPDINDATALVIRVKFNNPYTVTFNTSGGSTIANQIVEDGDYATRPSTDPQKNGYVFVDWYTDSTFSTLFDFTQAINSDKTVYAKYVLSDDQDKYTVTFETDGGTIYPNQIVEANEKAIRPQSNPVKDGYTFVDWYTSKDFKTKFDYNTKIIKDTTIYAKYNVKNINDDDIKKPLPNGGNDISKLIVLLMISISSIYAYRNRKHKICK